MAEEDKTEQTETADEAQSAAEKQAAAEDPNREGVIAALRRERAGYVLRKLDDRVAGVDAELKRLGADTDVAEEREQKAPRETAVESKPRSTAAASKPRGTASGRAKSGE